MPLFESELEVVLSRAPHLAQAEPRSHAVKQQRAARRVGPAKCMVDTRQGLSARGLDKQPCNNSLVQHGEGGFVLGRVAPSQHSRRRMAVFLLGGTLGLLLILARHRAVQRIVVCRLQLRHREARGCSRQERVRSMKAGQLRLLTEGDFLEEIGHATRGLVAGKQLEAADAGRKRPAGHQAPSVETPCFAAAASATRNGPQSKRRLVQASHRGVNLLLSRLRVIPTQRKFGINTRQSGPRLGINGILWLRAAGRLAIRIAAQTTAHG